MKKPINRRKTRKGMDSDGDGVPDPFDCEPFNPNAQGILHSVASKVGATAKKKAKSTVSKVGAAAKKKAKSSKEKVVAGIKKTPGTVGRAIDAMYSDPELHERTVAEFAGTRRTPQAGRGPPRAAPRQRESVQAPTIGSIWGQPVGGGAAQQEPPMMGAVPAAPSRRQGDLPHTVIELHIHGAADAPVVSVQQHTAQPTKAKARRPEPTFDEILESPDMW